MEILRVENLSKVYGKGQTQVTALDNVSFNVEKGEFVAIVGASGSGKSTLLHLIGGVDRPTSGKVFIDGKDIYNFNDDGLAIFRRRQVGLIYQFYNLIPILNVEENITLPFDDFFMFENKGLVSATPLDFTDPRFFKQKFQIMEIQPNFEYAQPLNLYHTNNVLQELKKRIGNIEKPIFLFINSTETIYSIMDKLDILEQSTVFCAPT